MLPSLSGAAARPLLLLLVTYLAIPAGVALPLRRPERLQVENRVDPLGMDVTAPRLSWNIGWPGAIQRAYQIRAASSPALLEQGAADLWDSGMVASARAIGVIWAGAPLRSRTRVAWQVRVWSDPDPSTPSAWSEIATFEMGLLEPADWSARWIAHPSRTYSQPLPLFAHEFTLSRAPARARLYITGLGIYVATINGRPVTDDVLTPGNTDYTRQVEVATYDVTGTLRAGANVIGVQLGNGTYNAVTTPGRYMKFVNAAPVSLRLLAQLEVSYPDGGFETIATGTAWRTTLGPTTVSTWFGGEDYDARREIAGWDQPGTDRSGWEHAVLSGPPAAGTVLAWRPAPPVRVTGRVAPAAVTEPRPGLYVFDMGVNFAGWQQLRVSGPAGATITMRIGELLNADGTVNQATTGSPIFDTYTLSGKGVETWHPQFEYHGFRYLEVAGLPAPPSDGTVTGLVLRAANEPAGSFEVSHPLLGRIHTIIDRAIQSNMFSIFTDCPDREKLGWLGDMQLILDSIVRNYDVAAYLRTVVRNMAEAQTAGGLVPDFVPEYTVYDGGFRSDPNWGNAMILAPWYLYTTYGDARTMETYYSNMQRYLAYLTSLSTGDLLDFGLGDWISPDRTLPVGITATYGYYRAADVMRRAAAVLGRAADADACAALASRIAAAFNARYLDRARHTYAAGQQAADALALDMGIVPAEERAAVLDHLIESLRAAGYHAHVGIVALPALFRVLAAAGRDDVIFDIATRTTHPSYGYQIVNGATSLTEDWDGPFQTSSQNHMMLGAIDEWFTAGLAGIQAAPGAVAYEALVIRPALVGDLTHVKGTYRTPHGLVSSEWALTRGGLRLDVTVPGNTTAAVYVPSPPAASPASPRGLHAAPRPGDYAVYHVGPGTYTFHSPRRLR